MLTAHSVSCATCINFRKDIDVSQICRLLYHVNLGVNFKRKIARELHCYSMDPVRSSMSKILQQMCGKQISFPFSPPRKVMSGQH